MKIYNFMTLLAISVIPIHAWRGPESENPAEKKQKTNFYGTLTTQQGNKIDVENITIDGRYRQIPMYECPSKEEKQSSKKNSREIPLDVDPSSDLVTTYIDLSETSEIQVPHHREIWTHQREDSKRKVRYIEVIVVPKGEPRRQHSYLIEYKSKIYCHGISKVGPEEKKVPISAVKALIIDGFCIRDESGQCPVPPYELKEKKQNGSMKKNENGNGNGQQQPVEQPVLMEEVRIQEDVIVPAA